MRKAMVRASLAAVAVCLPLAATASDYARTLAFEQAVDGLAKMVGEGQSASEVFTAAAASLGLEYPAALPAPSVEPVLGGSSVSIVSLDLVLSQLALQAGANYHVALRQAQARPEVLLVEAGVSSLAQLYRETEAAGLPGIIEKTPEGYIAHLPIAVWNGATLALQPGESLLLDRTAGAFLLAAGNLVATDGVIRSVGETNPRLAEFNPFIVVALSGSARLERMHLADLGFGRFPPMTGITIVESGFYAKPVPSLIRDSRLDNVGSLALIDAADALVEGNVLAGSEGASLLLIGGRYIVARGNVILTGPEAHGIKVTNGAEGVRLDNNIIVHAGLNGIFVAAGSVNLTIRNNLVAGSTRSGVSVVSADCIAVAGNLLLQNAQSGLAVRDSAGLSVSDNRFIDNGNAGISVTHQPDFGVIDIAANELDGNRVGIKGSTTARLAFTANDFTGQAPRLLAGELVQFADRFFNLRADDKAPTIIDGPDLKSGTRISPSGTLRPTSCSFEGDA